MLSESTQQPEVPQNQNELSPEQIALAEKIINYAKPLRDFVWVYRAEGEKDPKHMYSAGGQVLRGSWFTPSWATAQRYYQDRTRQEIPGMKIYALVLPKQILENREDIDVGMSQVNVVNPELQNGKIEVSHEQTSTPTAAEYIGQLDIVRRYAESQDKTVAQLIRTE